MTCSGTRPLTSPPYLAISLIRLELRNECSGLVVVNRVALRRLPIPMELEQAWTWCPRSLSRSGRPTPIRRHAVQEWAALARPHK